MSDWKSIETAPKDGTWVILYEYGVKPIPYDLARWVVESDGSWVTVENSSTRRVAEYVIKENGYWDCEHVYAPTHWKPIPDGPE